MPGKQYSLAELDAVIKGAAAGETDVEIAMKLTGRSVTSVRRQREGMCLQRSPQELKEGARP
jgi:hypothetical protein